MKLAFLLAAASSLTFAADRTILAIGAHSGDMELTAGAVLAKHVRLGDKVVLLHLTLGESGNIQLGAEKYAAQKRAEAEAAAKALGAQVLYGPYKDGQIPAGDEAAEYVARIIRQVRPTYVITHWKNSIHKDHSRTHVVANDAVLLASLPGWGDPSQRHGVRGVYFAENWEDPDGFQPYVYISVEPQDVEAWRKALQSYQFARGTAVYEQRYEALLKLRGAEVRKPAAEAFDIDALGKRRTLESLP